MQIKKKCFDTKHNQNFTSKKLSSRYFCIQGEKALVGFETVLHPPNTFEPRHEKTNILHMQKQRRRSASR